MLEESPIFGTTLFRTTLLVISKYILQTNVFRVSLFKSTSWLADALKLYDLFDERIIRFFMYVGGCPLCNVFSIRPV